MPRGPTSDASSSVSGRRVRARGAAAAAAAIVASVALVAHGGVTTDASWNDREFVHGAASTLDCAAAEGDFASRSAGRLLSGSLLGIDLDRIASVDGLVVTNDGSRSRPDASGAAPADPAPDAYADPLSAQALGLVEAQLPGVLQFPLGTDLGIAGQYARSSSDGTAVGAAGALTPSGGIALDTDGQYPELATVHVSQLLRTINPTAAPALEGVADVSLITGAVTGRSEVDGCALAWSGPATAVTRDYLAASLRTDITSPTVGALTSAVDASVDSLQRAADGIGGNAAVRGGITSGLTALVDGALDSSSGLRLSTVTVTELGAPIELAAVRALVSQPFGDAGGVVTVDPGAGTISVDTAALLTAAYPGQYTDGLNGLPPNTDLLSDPRIVTALTAALGAALHDWIADVEAALVTAIDAVAITAKASISLGTYVALPLLAPQWVDVARIDVDVSGSLGSLLDSGGVVTAEATLLSDVLGPLTAELDGLAAALVAGAGEVVGTTVDGALSAVGSIPAEIEALADPIVAAASTVYSTLFASGIVAVTVNAQNAPQAGSAQPHDWDALPGGRFEVAAMRIGVLGAVGEDDARLYLGRGSVGPGCVLASAPLPCAGY